MKTFKRLLGYAFPLRHYIPEYVIYTIVGVIFGLFNFVMLIPMMDTLFNKEAVIKAIPLPEFSYSIQYFKDLFNHYYTSLVLNGGPIHALVFVCCIIATCTIIANLGRYMASRTMIRMRMKILENLRNTLFRRLLGQSLSFYHNRQKGDILSVVTNDVQEVENTIVNSVQVLLRDPFVIVSTFILLFIISAKLTLFTIFFFPISGYLISYISKKLKKKGYYSQEMLGKILNVSEESLGNIKVIQGFGGESFVEGKFAKVNKGFTKISRSLFNQRELASPISELLGIVVVVILIIYGGYLILGEDGTLTAPAFIAYIGAYSQIIQPAKNISNAITGLQKGLVAGERIFAMIDEPVKIEDSPDAEPVASFDKNIEYKNVTFRYDQQNVLQDVSLNIEKGRMIALVGRSGSGKSTMVDLLPRFYDVTEGQLLLDGKDVKGLKLRDLRHLMGIVSQEAILFNDSVFNNIAFGQPDADPGAVIKAAKIANAHEFIENLENGYETTIGDRGMKLSGGQRQRLTIARAIFKNPPILILDEATSALDTESEKLVQDALDKVMQSRTTIVIAHRLSTIQHAHEIIVMDKGHIVEKGTHDMLMQNNGTYKKLVEMQEFK
ncbi:antibiotic ABC transporter ATP-binding protein [Chitinophaga caeni]|uniref:Antibiotic ABC transporter ATP-binding protein n=1 Tax=Chitinophaga caeni TaxID=2029983 RepID=A0A291QST6_9BACT|nr:ABC transporter ATP-binding protein [Chitinophaga caeni]ATL46914.1 antibiotic ABC transporter ATP-binding protein [Chitinophaga caeni]